MEHLYLEGTSLEEEGVQHGENLLIMEGRLPPKGFLNFSIYLFPALEQITVSPTANVNGLHYDLESKCFLYKCSFLIFSEFFLK